MVDTDDTRFTTDAGRRTTPRVWHKLPTGELKIGNKYLGLGYTWNFDMYDTWIHHQKGKNLNFLMSYVRLRKIKPV